RPVMDVGDHRLNLVQTVAIEVRDLSDPVELAIDAHLMQAALGYGGNNIAVMTLALANERREYDERLFGEIKCDPFRPSSRIGRFPGDGAFGAVGHTERGKQQAKVVVDLGCRPDR